MDLTANLQRAKRIVTSSIGKPPVANAGDAFKQIGVEINHPVTPAVGGFCFAGMQLVRIHGDDRVGGRDVLGTTITKAFSPGFNHADTKRFVGVGLKGVTRDMGMIQL